MLNLETLEVHSKKCLIPNCTVFICKDSSLEGCLDINYAQETKLWNVFELTPASG